MAKLKFKTIKEDETKLNGRQFFLKNKDQPIKEPEDEDDEEEEEDNEDEEDSDYNEVESDDDDQKPFK